MKRSLIVGLIVPATLGLVVATTPVDAPASDAADSAFRSDTIRLLELTGSTQLAGRIADSVNTSTVHTLREANPDIPPRAFDIVVEVVDSMFVDAMGPQLIDAMVEIYRRHFTHEEIRGLIAFYETPLGRKTVAAMPAVVGESLAAGQAWAERSEPRFQQEVQRRLVAEGIVVR
jgi:hypothetical protein